MHNILRNQLLNISKKIQTDKFKFKLLILLTKKKIIYTKQPENYLRYQQGQKQNNQNRGEGQFQMKYLKYYLNLHSEIVTQLIKYPSIRFHMINQRIWILFLQFTRRFIRINLYLMKNN